MNEYRHKYRMLWKTKSIPEGILRDDVPEEFEGTSDAVLIASLIYPPDGSLSMQFVGIDGRAEGVLDDKEWFKVWVFLAKRLSESETLNAGHRALAEVLFNTYVEGLKSKRTGA